MWYVASSCLVLFKRLASGRHLVRPSNQGRREPPMRRRYPKLALLLIAVMLAGCAPKSFFISENIRPRTSGVRVLLMPSDIELYELTAGGLLEPKAEWTARARLHVSAALKKELREKNVELLPYQPPTDMPSRDYGYHQLLKLHEAVGGAILRHKYEPRFKLPTKEEKFDWSLGRGVNDLGEEYDAQYGLFIHFRDSYASAGRVTFIILATVVSFGHVVPSAGMQIAFASLVDLQSGDIIWFNRLIRGTGDLRTPDPAQEAVEQLLADLPL